MTGDHRIDNDPWLQFECEVEAGYVRLLAASAAARRDVAPALAVLGVNLCADLDPFDASLRAERQEWRAYFDARRTEGHYERKRLE